KRQLLISLKAPQQSPRRKLSSVDAAPTAVPPGQIPRRAGWKVLRYIVDAGRAPGLAAQQSRQRHPSAAPQAEALDRLVAINGAGRQVTAVVADQRRQAMPVEPD